MVVTILYGERHTVRPSRSMWQTSTCHPRCSVTRSHYIWELCVSIYPYGINTIFSSGKKYPPTPTYLPNHFSPSYYLYISIFTLFYPTACSEPTNTTHPPHIRKDPFHPGILGCPISNAVIWRTHKKSYQFNANALSLVVARPITMG